MDLWTQYLKYENDVTYNDAENGLRKLCVGLSATFYFWGGETREKRLAIVHCFEVFERLFKSRLEWIKPCPDVGRGAIKIGGEKPVPSLRGYISTMGPDDQLEWRISGGHSVHAASDCYAVVLTARHWQTTGTNPPLSWLSFAMPVTAAYGPGGQPNVFVDFIRLCCEQLRPWHGCGGLASLLPQNPSESFVDEFEVQQRYFGLDVVSTGYFLKSRLQRTIKGVNWLTFFDSEFSTLVPTATWDALRGTADVQIWKAASTYVIQAGAQPTLGPVPDGIPPLYKVVSDALRPLRIDPMPSFHIGSMTGEIRFNGRTSELWSQRFDAPGIWPPYPDQIEFYKVDNAVDEYAMESSVSVEPQPPAEFPSQANVISALPGQRCPRSGKWVNHFLRRTVHVETGEPMPGPEVDGNGNGIVWFWRD